MHSLSLIPLILGLILLIIGRIFNDLPMIGLGIVILVWGLWIHGNNIRIERKMQYADLRRNGYKVVENKS